jgi:acetolactate decarboxylase
VRLIEAYKAQGIFTFTHQDGILFGYKFPKYLKDVNMDDYHLHFLATDKSKGGHLLNCTILNGEIAVAAIRNFQLQLPDNNYFSISTFTNSKSELLKIEGGKN